MVSEEVLSINAKSSLGVLPIGDDAIQQNWKKKPCFQ
jgi:hypothetical protein